jgi:hypothetical protein
MDKNSIINIINSILLASSSSSARRRSSNTATIDTCGDGCDLNHGHDDDSGIAAVMLKEGNVTITPITGGLTNALYKVDYTAAEEVGDGTYDDGAMLVENIVKIQDFLKIL